MAEESLTVRDNRSGEEVEIPIVDGTIHATELKKLGLMSYDPAFLNTASTRSSITYIDGDAGILRYRGYPIEQLAEEASFLEIVVAPLRGRAADAGRARRVAGRDAHPHVRPHERHAVPRRLPPRRASDGDAARRDRRALDVLSRREGDRRRGEPAPPARAAHREVPDDRRVGRSGTAAACRTSSRGTTSTTSATSST